jgi:hypothetical protein
MKSIKETYNKLIENNSNEAILEFYNDYFSDCFVILHPFYKKVFIDEYEFLNSYQYSSKLIERIQWASILKLTGIKTLSKLALTITFFSIEKKLQSLVESEKNEFEPFLKENNIIEPYWSEDKIPEDVVLSFLNMLIQEGYSEVLYSESFENIKNEILETRIESKNIFEVVVKFSKLNFILTKDKKFCLKLPDHDLPYTFLLTNQISAMKTANLLNFEGFVADFKTKPYWHKENYYT